MANYFMGHVRPEEGDVMTNLKMQKLLYLAQGFYLGMFDKPLFEDDIELWVHGPVVPKLFKKFQKNENGIIEYDSTMKMDDIDDETKGLLDEVYTVYGQFSASALKDIVSADPPIASKNIRDIISADDMREYFKDKLN